jgi:hypothetical protein
MKNLFISGLKEIKVRVGLIARNQSLVRLFLAAEKKVQRALQRVTLLVVLPCRSALVQRLRKKDRRELNGLKRNKY